MCWKHYPDATNNTASYMKQMPHTDTNLSMKLFCTESIATCRTTVWDDLRQGALSLWKWPSDDGTLCSRGDGRQQNWQRLSEAQVPEDRLCPEKIVHTNSLDCCRRAAWSRAFMLFTPDCEQPHKCCARNRFANLPLSNFQWARVNGSLGLLALSRQGAAPCVFYCCFGSPASRSGTLIVTSGYFSSCCCLSVVSYQSVHSDPPDTDESFPSKQLPLTHGYFPLLGTILRKPWRCLCQC